MSATSLLFQFEKNGAASGGVVNKDKAVISGVSMITGDVTAKGHDLEVDGITLEQLLTCAEKKGKVPVKTNHGSGVDAVNGYLQNFRIEEGKLRADWHLLKSYPQTEQLLEMAERMPESVGLSVAFHGVPETADGRKVLAELDDKGAVKFYYTLGKGGEKVPLKANEKKHARCSELVSTDLVASPAANPDGMFSARRVDSAAEGMAKPSTSLNPAAAAGAAPAAEPTLADIANLIKGLSDRVGAIEAGSQHQEPDGDENGDEVELTQEQVQEGLAQGWLVQDKDGNLQMVGEPADDEGAGDGDGDEAAQNAALESGQPDTSDAAVHAALARGDMATYFQILHLRSEERIAALEHRFEAEDAAKQRAAEHAAFTTLEAKQTALVTNLSAAQDKIKAQEELIRELQSGAPRVKSGGDATLFSAGHGSSGATTFDSEVTRVHNEMLVSHPQMQEFERKGAALAAVQKTRPDLYEAHLKAKGIKA